MHNVGWSLEDVNVSVDVVLHKTESASTELLTSLSPSLHLHCGSLPSMISECLLF